MFNLIAQGVGAGLNQMLGGIARRKQRQHERSMAEYAYSKDLEMWERQNEYNAPTQQMSRLKEAGLNPALMYGKGSSVGNTSGQMPKYQAPRQEYGYDPVNVGSMMNLYQDFKQKNANIDLTRERERLIREQANAKEKEAGWSGDFYGARASDKIAQFDKRAYENAVARNNEFWYDYRGGKHKVSGGRLPKLQDYQLQGRQAQIRQANLRSDLLQKDLDYYLLNKLAGPVLNTVKMIPGIGSMFKKSGNVARPRGIPKQTLPDWKYGSWKR